MDEVVHREVLNRLVVDREALAEPERLHLGSIFGGAFLGIAIWATLEVLWLGIGLAAVNHGASANAFGIGTGLWSLVALIVSLFVGGLVASRLAGPLGRLAGALHGLVVWAIATIAAVFFMLSLGGALLGTAARLGGGAAGVAAQGVGSLVSGGQAGAAALGLDSSELLKVINARLDAAGKPNLTQAELKRTLDDVLATAAREGHLDRHMVETKLADNTALSRADAAQVTAQLEQRWNQGASAVSQRVSSMTSTVEATFMRVLSGTAKGMFCLFAAMVLSCAAAVLGATAGARKRGRLLRVEEQRSLPPPSTTAPLPSR